MGERSVHRWPPLRSFQIAWPRDVAVIRWTTYVAINSPKVADKCMVPECQEKEAPVKRNEEQTPQTGVHALDDHRPPYSIWHVSDQVGDAKTETKHGDCDKCAQDRRRDEKPKGFSICPTADPEHYEANDDATGSSEPGVLPSDLAREVCSKQAPCESRNCRYNSRFHNCGERQRPVDPIPGVRPQMQDMSKGPRKSIMSWRDRIECAELWWPSLCGRHPSSKCLNDGTALPDLTIRQSWTFSILV